jgi:hypothetical protein
MRAAFAVHTTRIVGFALASLIAMSASFPCSIRPTDLRQLDLDTDIIAVGVIHIVREQAENAGKPDETVTGVARIDVKRYLRNRDLRSRWIEFPYESFSDPDCGLDFGVRPEAGQMVKVWFGRQGSRLELLRFEAVDVAEPEEDDEEEEG